MKALKELDEAGRLKTRVATYIDHGSVLSLERDVIGEPLLGIRRQFASQHVLVDSRNSLWMASRR